MPLSHVCVWDADIGYKRISLESACKMYPNGASAKSGYFVCELCAQNVLLTAPGVNVRHFRHDPSSPNKECDERQAHFDPLYGRRLRNLNSHLIYTQGIHFGKSGRHLWNLNPRSPNVCG